jgi:hypothetical protein
MDKVFNNPQYIEIENRIVQTIVQVEKRGFDEIDEEIDDYSELIEQAEFRNALITELYESYFPPKRHEFELQIIVDIVEAVINSKLVIFTAGAAASGLIGDTFTNVVKRLLYKIIDSFKNSKNEQKKFNELLSDIEKVENYFIQCKKQEIKVLVKELKIEKERLVPIMKLLGFKTNKKKGKKYWEKNTGPNNIGIKAQLSQKRW